MKINQIHHCPTKLLCFKDFSKFKFLYKMYNVMSLIVNTP